MTLLLPKQAMGYVSIQLKLHCFSIPQNKTGLQTPFIHLVKLFNFSAQDLHETGVVVLKD